MDNNKKEKNIIRKNLGIIGGTVTFLTLFLTIGYILITMLGPTGGVGDSLRIIALYAYLFGIFIISIFVAAIVYKSLSSNSVEY